MEQRKEEEEESSEKQRPRASKDPPPTSEQERIQHEITHLRFRSWHHGKRARRGLSQINRGRETSPSRQEGRNKTFFLVARERGTRAVLSTVVPRKSTGEWICRRPMAWLREIGLELVDITVKSDSEPASTSLIVSWSTLRGMKRGLRIVSESGPVGSSKSNGIVERAIQSVQGMVRTTRSAIEENWEVKIDVTHSVWPWIVEPAGSLFNKGSVATAKRRTSDHKENQQRCKACRSQTGMLWKTRGARGPLGKFTCMWKGGVHLGIKATTGGHRGEPERRVARKNVPPEDSERKVRTKQSGDARGGPVAQERRRRKHGW